MNSILLLFPLVVLFGLCFVMFIGRRRRRDQQGELAAPAPGSPDAPIFGEPQDNRSNGKAR